MDIISNLGLGFATALTGVNLLYCLAGVFLGTLIGVLPGLGPTATIAMLLPVTFTLPPVSALIMLAGIYYGSQYGGSTTSILVNVPGEAASVVTALDGYQMARRGRAGVALATSAIGSFFAGTVATVILALFAPGLAAVALKFGPAEFFSLMVLGLLASLVLARGSLLHASGMVVLGLLLGLIGQDVTTGTQRFTFDLPQLADGVGFVVVAMGMFGLAEIVRNMENETEREVGVEKITSLMPTKEDWKRMAAPILRGTAIGSVLGILPGSGSILGSFAAYAVEKKVSKRGAEFGSGAIEGVAAPESANNAGAQTSFIPMLTLGIPSNPVMALMVGAMIIQGIQPGPSVISEQPALFWGLIASMWVGNLMLVVLNLPMVGMWVKLCSIPYHRLFPAILVFCAIGVFSLNNAEFDVYLMALFGVIGYLFVKLDAEPAPMLLAFILGPMMEEYLRRALLLSRGDPMVFLTRPISATRLLWTIERFALRPRRSSRDGGASVRLFCRLSPAQGGIWASIGFGKSPGFRLDRNGRGSARRIRADGGCKSRQAIQLAIIRAGDWVECAIRCAGGNKMKLKKSPVRDRKPLRPAAGSSPGRLTGGVQ